MHFKATLTHLERTASLHTGRSNSVLYAEFYFTEGKKPPVYANTELTATKGEQKLQQDLARQRRIVSMYFKILLYVKVLYTEKLNNYIGTQIRTISGLSFYCHFVKGIQFVLRLKLSKNKTRPKQDDFFYTRTYTEVQYNRAGALMFNFQE